MSGRLSKSAIFAALPPPWPEDLRPHIRSASRHTAETRTVLDASATQSALVEVFGNRSIENENYELEIEN